MILANLIFFLVRLSDVKALFYSSGTKYGKVKYKDIIHKATAPSLISCSLRCRVIDADADVIFEMDVCSCIKKSGNHDDDSKEVTLTGIFLTTKPTLSLKRWKRIVIVDNKESPIIRNTLKTTIPKLTKEYILSIDLKPTVWKNSNRNVLSMTTSNDHNKHGFRTPAIFMNKNHLDVYSTVNSKSNYKASIGDYTVKKWINIKVSQTEESSGRFLFSVKVNGMTMHSIVNNNPLEFSQVKCFLSEEPRHEQPGLVKNVWVDVRVV